MIYCSKKLEEHLKNTSDLNGGVMLNIFPDKK